MPPARPPGPTPEPPPATGRRRNQWSTGPDDGTPAEELPCGAVIDYPAGRMLLTRVNNTSDPLLGKRTTVHGVILTAPPGDRAWRVGEGTERMLRRRQRITVHEIRPIDPKAPCPCGAHRRYRGEVITTMAFDVPGQTGVLPVHRDGLRCDHNLNKPDGRAACPGRVYEAFCTDAACNLGRRAADADTVRVWKNNHRASHAAGTHAGEVPDHAISLQTEPRIEARCRCGQFEYASDEQGVKGRALAYADAADLSARHLDLAIGVVRGGVPAPWQTARVPGQRKG